MELEFDPSRTTYKDLLDIFWKNHDPTISNKRQYMSAIFYHDGEQRMLAEQTRELYQKTIRRTIVTKILPAKTFYDAEQYVVLFPLIPFFFPFFFVFGHFYVTL